MPAPFSDENKTYTYGQYRNWPEEQRWELIEGTPFAMSPAPSTAHQRVAGDLFNQIYNFLEGRECEVFIAPFDVRLPEAQEADDDIESVVQPDIALVCDPSKIDEKGCRGTPDWIIEVLSPTTASKDFIKKRQLYEKHQVREYWLVHPMDRLVTVFVLNEEGRFEISDYYDINGKPSATVLPDLTIDPKSVFR